VPQSQTGRYGENKKLFAPVPRQQSMVKMIGEMNKIRRLNVDIILTCVRKVRVKTLFAGLRREI